MNHLITLPSLKREVSAMTKPETRTPWWLAIDVSVIVISMILIGIVLWLDAL